MIALVLLVLVAQMVLALMVGHLVAVLEPAIAHLALEQRFPIVGPMQSYGVLPEADAVVEVAAAYRTASKHDKDFNKKKTVLFLCYFFMCWHICDSYPKIIKKKIKIK